jgi:outer membrane protein OmpA-like peptidoglycan-associated protein
MTFTAPVELLRTIGLRSLVLMGVSTAILMPIASHAQSRLTVGELTSQLNQTAESAKKIGIDVDAVRRDIEARISAEGTDNAQGVPDVSQVLKNLPNFIVQIQFALNSDVISPGSWETVGRIADAMYNPLLAGDRFLIVGNTDAKGKRAANLKLSERRAAAVAEMLVNVFRVPPQRLLTMGLGEEQLLDAQNPDDGINRRVQLINIGPI